MTNLRNDVWLYGVQAALRYRIICMVRCMLPHRYWRQATMWALYGRWEG